MLYTYFIYISILLLGSAFSFCVEKSKTKDSELVFRSLLFIVFLLPAMFRYDVAADYSEYERIYNQNLFWGYAEPGFCIILSALKKINCSSFWMFSFIAFLTYFPLCFLMRKLNFSVFIFYYIAYYGYFNTFDQIRQALALPFIVFSIESFIKKEYKHTILYLAVATSFHVSSIIFIILLPLYINVKYRFLLLIFLLIVFLSIDYSKVIEIISLKMNFRYLGLLWRSLNKTAKLGSGLLLKLVIPFSYMLFVTEKNKQNRKFVFGVNFSMLYILASFMVLKIDIFNRLRDVIWIGLLFGVKNIPEHKHKKLLIYFMIFSGILLYIYFIGQNVSSGTKQIAPYKSIFDSL